jgi:MFS family permease
MRLDSTRPVALTTARQLVAPRRLAFWLVALAFSVTMLGTTLPTPLYVLYEQKLRFSALTTTVIFAVYASGVLAALLLFGRASDQLGRRPVLRSGLVCAALSAVAFLLARGLALLVVGRMLSGLSAGIFSGTATATLVDLAGEGGARRATLVATASLTGGPGLGPLLAGVLAQIGPLPLRLPFWVDLGMVLLAIAALRAVPETVDVPAHPRLRMSRPDVPPQMRATLIRAATAAFAGAAVLGLFAAVAPSFLTELLHEHNHALSGAVVFAVFAASMFGQVALAGRFGRWGLAAGGVGLIAGMGLVAGGLAATSLALMLAGGIVAGVGQGLGFRSGLQRVNTEAPAERRAGVASSFFIVMSTGYWLPVLGEGIAASALGLRTAGIALAVAVAVIAAIALATLIGRARSDATRRDGLHVAPGVDDGIGEAWRALAAELDRRLREGDPEARVQVSLAPSGLLQLEVHTTPRQRSLARQLAHEYEDRARRICERCGRRVSVAGAGPVVTILCEQCLTGPAARASTPS